MEEVQKCDYCLLKGTSRRCRVFGEKVICETCLKKVIEHFLPQVNYGCYHLPQESCDSHLDDAVAARPEGGQPFTLYGYWFMTDPPQFEITPFKPIADTNGGNVSLRIPFRDSTEELNEMKKLFGWNTVTNSRTVFELEVRVKRIMEPHVDVRWEDKK